MIKKIKTIYQKSRTRHSLFIQQRWHELFMGNQTPSLTPWQMRCTESTLPNVVVVAQSIFHCRSVCSSGGFNFVLLFGASIQSRATHAVCSVCFVIFFLFGLLLFICLLCTRCCTLFHRILVHMLCSFKSEVISVFSNRIVGWFDSGIIFFFFLLFFGRAKFNANRHFAHIATIKTAAEINVLKPISCSDGMGYRDGRHGRKCCMKSRTNKHISDTVLIHRPLPPPHTAPRLNTDSQSVNQTFTLQEHQ